MTTVRVRVPATSANLGPGFDTLGLALNIYNYVTISETTDDSLHVAVTGEGSALLPCDERNIAVVAARRLLQLLGAPSLNFTMSLDNHIPLARGLGSSSAARVGALVAANEWAARQGWGSVSSADLLNIATRLEGHPDNAAATLLGGLVVSAMAEGEDEVVALRLPVEKFPSLAVFIPDTELATDTARAVLPDAVFRADANFNVARTGLLLTCLATGQWKGLREALQDKLHQEHRAALMPGFHAIIRAAVENAAFGATLSGAGPSILAWAPLGNIVIGEVCQAMQDAAATHEVFGRALEVRVDIDGTVVLDG